MKPFLYRIAEAFHTEHGQNISNFTFVFPNRRAGLFFQKYLTRLIDKPLFSPDILTVNDVFYSASELQAADRTDLLFRLYRIFGQISRREETFDTFVGWGEMLLNDFDDVDKYLVDAKQIFTNVTELKEIDRLFNPFSEKQVKALQQFWEHFVPVTEGKTQEDFIAVWRVLLPVYQQFREELLAENLATEAMVFRQIAERLKQRNSVEFFEGKKFVFIGFNALNPCERTLFEELQKNSQADFYWDYEGDELRDADNPASFHADNTKRFPSRFNIPKEVYLDENKRFTLTAIPSAVGQAKEAYHLLNELYPAQSRADDWIKTAVVLPDENLLLPLLYSLPQQIDKVNVTMGFPLKSTPVAGLVEHLFNLQKRTRKTAEGNTFYYQTVWGVLNHPYVQLVCNEHIKFISSQIIAHNWVYVNEEIFANDELLKLIFSPCADAKLLSEYLLQVIKNLHFELRKISEEDKKYRLECDFLYQYYVTLNRLNDVMKRTSVEMEISLDTMVRMVRQLTQGLTIPFEGEPLDGLQIMGTLETRGLDFENVIICSFNEGVFPKRTQPNSFIPYNLRKAFELPTSEHQDAVSAYHFYRLIQRAKRLFFLYDARTEAGQTGEVSRFAHQLRYHYGANIEVRNLTYDIQFPDDKPIAVQKTPEVMSKLQRFVNEEDSSSAFSASSLNNYVDCPLKFYLSQVESVEQPDEVQENIEANMFGTLLHDVMQYLYEPFEGKMVNASDIDEMLKNPPLIDKLIRKAFADKYFRKKDADIPLEGNYLLIGKVIEKYAKQILRYDKSQTPFTYIKSEERCTGKIPIHGGALAVNLKGFIDRVEEKSGVVRVIDYKSGAGDLNFKDLDEVFRPENDKRPKYVLQTFLYSLLYKQKADNKVIVPQIYYVRSIFKNDFTTEIVQKPERNVALTVENFADYEKEFNEKLTALLEEIYNPEIPFTQCESGKPCEYCAFNVICRR